MFEDKLEMALTSYGMTEQAFLSLLRDEPYLSDVKIFTISRLISKNNPNVILSKKVGYLNINCRRYDIAIDFIIGTSNKCIVSVDLVNYTLKVKYKDLPDIIIDKNMFDYKGEHTTLIDLRQEALNEVLTRYFAKILIAIYKELRWYL